MFASLIGQEKTSDDNVFNECIRRVIASTPALLEKVGYPSRNDCETCRFSQHDYDDDNDFSHDFTRKYSYFIVAILRVFREIAVLPVKMGCIGKCTAPNYSVEFVLE